MKSQLPIKVQAASFRVSCLDFLSNASTVKPSFWID